MAWRAAERERGIDDRQQAERMANYGTGSCAGSERKPKGWMDGWWVGGRQAGTQATCEGEQSRSLRASYSPAGMGYTGRPGGQTGKAQLRGSDRNHTMGTRGSEILGGGGRRSRALLHEPDADADAGWGMAKRSTESCDDGTVRWERGMHAGAF